MRLTSKKECSYCTISAAECGQLLPSHAIIFLLWNSLIQYIYWCLLHFMKFLQQNLLFNSYGPRNLKRKIDIANLLSSVFSIIFSAVYHNSSQGWETEPRSLTCSEEYRYWVIRTNFLLKRRMHFEILNCQGSVQFTKNITESKIIVIIYLKYLLFPQYMVCKYFLSFHRSYLYFISSIVQKLFCLKFHLLIFLLLFVFLMLYPKSILTKTRSWASSQWFSSLRIFMVSGLMFKSLIHLKLFLVSGVS